MARRLAKWSSEPGEGWPHFAQLTPAGARLVVLGQHFGSGGRSPGGTCAGADGFGLRGRPRSGASRPSAHRSVYSARLRARFRAQRAACLAQPPRQKRKPRPPQRHRLCGAAVGSMPLRVLQSYRECVVKSKSMCADACACPSVVVFTCACSSVPSSSARFFPLLSFTSCCHIYSCHLFLASLIRPQRSIHQMCAVAWSNMSRRRDSPTQPPAVGTFDRLSFRSARCSFVQRASGRGYPCWVPLYVLSTASRCGRVDPPRTSGARKRRMLRGAAKSR